MAREAERSLSHLHRRGPEVELGRSGVLLQADGDQLGDRFGILIRVVKKLTNVLNINLPIFESRSRPDVSGNFLDVGRPARIFDFRFAERI